jgi:peptide deformylase
MFEILKYPNKKLREKAKEVKKDENVRKIAEQMLKAMYSAPGIGLAATQVGIPLRIIVIDITPPDQPKNPIVLLNPLILQTEGKTKFEEGCLSLPGLFEEVERSSKIWFTGYDLNWKEVSGTAEGLLARAIQHEIDHLDGILFIDRLSPLKKKLAIRRYKELHSSTQTR